MSRGGSKVAASGYRRAGGQGDETGYGRKNGRLLRLPDKLADRTAVVVVMAQFGRQFARAVVNAMRMSMIGRGAVPVSVATVVLRAFRSHELRRLAVLKQQMQPLAPGRERAEGRDQHTGGQTMGECAHKDGEALMTPNRQPTSRCALLFHHSYDGSQGAGSDFCRNIASAIHNRSLPSIAPHSSLYWHGRSARAAGKGAGAQIAMRIAMNENG